MGIKTKIEWCDSSLNLQMGCNGCELWTAKTKQCYAGILVERYKGRKGWPSSFEQPVIFPERLDKALKWTDLTGKERKDKPWLNYFPRHIFLNDMGDTFTENLPIDWLLPFIPDMKSSPHIFMILTKRPRRMKTFFVDCLGHIPNNFMLGVSITNQQNADKRIPELREIPARVRFLSIEPLLGLVETTTHLDRCQCGHHMEPHQYVHKGLTDSCGICDCITFSPNINWVIVGGESGPNARPMHPDWARSIRDQCQGADVPFFMKQMDKVQPIPDDLFIREFPELSTSAGDNVL